jgi:microcystin-dependent protein
MNRPTSARFSMRPMALAAMGLFSVSMSQSALADCDMENYLGGVCMTAASYCPRGTIEANGQLLPISSYSALFSLYGTTFGGDGRTTFAIPDLRSRTPVGIGQGGGLSQIRLGQKGGVESVTLTSQQLPVHNHPATTMVTVQAHNTDAADASSPSGVVLGDPKVGLKGDRDIYSSLAPNATLNSAAATATTQLANSGGNQPMPIRNPYLGMRYCVVVQGIFPPRN